MRLAFDIGEYGQNLLRMPSILQAGCDRLMCVDGLLKLAEGIHTVTAPLEMHHKNEALVAWVYVGNPPITRPKASGAPSMRPYASEAKHGRPRGGEELGAKAASSPKAVGAALDATPALKAKAAGTPKCVKLQAAPKTVMDSSMVPLNEISVAPD